MSETIERTYTPRPHAAIKAISQYLKEAPLTRHADLLRAELIDLISQEKMTAFIAGNILESGDIEVIRALIDSGFNIKKVPGINSLSNFSFAEVPAGQRTELFNLISSKVDPASSSLAGTNVQKAMNQALSVRDHDLLKAICDWAPNHNFDDLIWGSGKLDSDAPKAPKFWRAMLEQVDMSSEASQYFAAKGLTNGWHPRALAAMIELGLHVSPLIKATSVKKDHPASWLVRLRARAGSAHGEMDLKKSLPPLDEILTMPAEHLHVVLGGLSNRQKRKLRNFDRKGKIPKTLRDLKAVTAG